MEIVKEMQASDNEVNRLLCVFVVNHEIKKLTARRRAPKSTKTKASGVDDDCDDDAE